MNIFKLSNEEFEKYLESEEFEKLKEDFVEYIEKLQDKPGYYSEECWDLSCKYNSNHIKDLEMGYIPYCTRFAKGEKNTCEFIDKEHF